MALTVAVVLACRGAGREAVVYSSSEETFQAGMILLNEGKPERAATLFERLTQQLGACDTLYPRSYFYLGKAQYNAKEWLAARTAFGRFHSLFSTDSLADDALLWAARSSRKLWPDPELDSDYGEDAKALLGTLLQSYPNTPLRETAFAELDAVDNALASKDYGVAEDYYKNKVWYGAIKYSTEVIDRFPATAVAKKARVLLVKTYRKLDWKPEAAENCKTLREMYREDREIAELCGSGAPAGPIPP